MIYVDVKFANMLAPRLRNFKHKSEFLWNFSCPVCGDSKKNKLKARSYIYRTKTGLFVKCHNCDYSTNLGNLIKYLDPVMYQEYVLENYKESGAPRSHHKDLKETLPELINVISDSVLDGAKCLSTLPLDHPAVKYVLDRKLPLSTLKLLYVTAKFKQFVNGLVPGKFQSVDDDHPRLIIPYFTEHGKCFAFQGRAFGDEQPKYYTIKLDESRDRIYGLDRVDFSKKVYILEGPLDSLLLPNAIAVSGSSFTSETTRLIKTNCTLVYDNEPRSKELTKLIHKSIMDGYDVCLWPDTVQEKDINEMIMAGKSVEDIMTIINDNTFNGAAAQLRFTTWRKC